MNKQNFPTQSKTTRYAQAAMDYALAIVIGSVLAVALVYGLTS